MLLPFREHHLLSCLQRYEEKKLPLDIVLREYLRMNKSVGSHGRQAIAEGVYGMMRWRGLLDHLSSKPPSWEKRWALFQTVKPGDHLEDSEIPLHIRCSCPKDFFTLLTSHFGEEKASELSRIINTPAPTTVRVNTLKITREALLEKWKNSAYKVSPCTCSSTGIIFQKKENFLGMAELKEGLFEGQDEGSQLVAELVKAEPGQQVMDFCAGSGGKTLAIASRLGHKGQIHLHDIRPHALDAARLRLKRAGVQNAQIHLNTSTYLPRLKKAMHWVLADVPCSGTGTLRRNPDMKWRFDRAALQQTLKQQRDIFQEALGFMRPDGRIVYATCSLLPEENEAQIEYFIRTHKLEVEGECFKRLPTKGGMDGFFAAVLKHQASAESNTKAEAKTDTSARKSSRKSAKKSTKKKKV